MFNYAQSVGITCFSTPFDESAVDLLEDLNTPAYKVASFDIGNMDLLEKVAKTNKPIIIKQGPYGIYIETEDKEGDKPRRASVPKNIPLEQLNLEKALQLLSLPREVGKYPKNNEIIIANNGRFGPYLKVGDYFISLKEDDVYTVGENRAIDLIEEHFKKIEKRTIGIHNNKELSVSKRGRIGYFLKNGTTSIRIPNEIDAKTISLEKAIELIEIKKEKDKEKKKKTKKKK